MASLNDLPTEILLQIVENLLPHPDLAALVATNRRMHEAGVSSLYRQAEPSLQKRAMFWSTFNGNLDIVRRFLDTGADANQYWHGRRSSQRYPALVTMAQEHARLPTKADLLRKSVDLTVRGRILRMEESWEPSYVDQVIRAKEKIFDRNASFHWTLLHVAAQQGHDHIIKLLLKHGADPSLSSQDACRCKATYAVRNPRAKRTHYPPWSALHLAICNGNESTAQLLLAGGAPIWLDRQQRPPPSVLERHQTHGETALHAAARYGLVPLVEHIIDQGFQNAEDEDGRGETPLAFAFVYRQWDCIKSLLSKGADINRVFDTQTERNPQNISGNSLLAFACSHRRFADAIWLVNCGADLGPLQLRPGDPPKPLIDFCLESPWQSEDFEVLVSGQPAIVNEKKQEIHFLNLLHQKGVPVFASEPLLTALRNAHVPAIDYILSLGTKIRSIESSGSTHILEVCTKPELLFGTNLVKRLLEMGANARCDNERGQTPLHLVCRAYCSSPKIEWNRVVQIIDLLLLNGADLTARGYVSGGYLTPFEQALCMSNYRLANVLLSRSGQTSFTDEEIQHLFKLTCRSGNEDCLRLVLSLDENDVIVQDEDNLLRLLTYSKSSTEAALILIDKGIPCTASIHEDCNTVFLAVHQKRGEKLIRKLLEGGADPNFVRGQGLVATCPLLEALRIGNWDRTRGYVKLLLEYGADIGLPLGKFRRRPKCQIQHESMLELCLTKGDNVLTNMLKNAFSFTEQKYGYELHWPTTY